jgi:hypothetical protein
MYRNPMFVLRSGSTPPDSILKTFLEMAEKVEGGIAGQFSAHSLNFFYNRIRLVDRHGRF